MYFYYEKNLCSVWEMNKDAEDIEGEDFAESVIKGKHHCLYIYFSNKRYDYQFMWKLNKQEKIIHQFYVKMTMYKLIDIMQDFLVNQTVAATRFSNCFALFL